MGKVPVATDRGVRSRLRRLALLATLVAAAVSCLARAVPLPLGVVLLGASLLVPCGAWFRDPDACVSSLRRGALNVVLLTVVSLASLVGIEVAARWLFPQIARPGTVAQFDPEYIFITHPRGRATFYARLTEEKSRRDYVQLSSQGLRDREYPPKASNAFRILLLGDSFTFGAAVDARDSIPKQLERLFDMTPAPRRFEVLNGGLSGACPLQELGMLRKRGIPLSPDLAILQLFLGNDLNECLGSVGSHLRAYSVDRQKNLRRRPRSNLLPFRVERWVRTHSVVYIIISKATGDRDWFVGLFQQLRWYPSFDYPALGPSEPREHGNEANLVQVYPELQEAFSMVEKYIVEMRDECSNRGIGFAVYCVPAGYEVDDARWAAVARQGYGDYAYRHLGGIGRIEAFLRQQGIRTFSVVDALRQGGPIDDLYFSLDGHLTERGCGIVAQRIHDFLVNDYFRTSGIAP